MSNCKTCLETVDIYTYIAPLNMTIYTFVLGYKYIIIIGIHQAPVALFIYPTVNLTYQRVGRLSM